MTASRAGIFGYTTKNLGDDMQSIAALTLLNRVDGIFSRDLIHEARHKPPATCIFNSWFKQGELYRAPSKAIDPLMYGVAVGKPEILNGPWNGYLHDHGPIGCRDRHTEQFLRSHGIDAHFSGCLTLQMGRRMRRVPDERRTGVLVVDMDEDWLAERFDPALWRDARFLSMNIEAARNRPFLRLKLISDVLKQIAFASLVITRRLHVGSPAASLGTPVILLPERSISKASERFSGFEELLRFRYQDELAPGARLDPDQIKNEGVLEHAEVNGAYDRLQGELEARGLLAEEALSWDYPEHLSFLFDAASWPPSAVLYARCGWAEQALPVSAGQRGIVEASLPGFLGHERFRLTFFVENSDGRRLRVEPVGDQGGDIGS